MPRESCHSLDGVAFAWLSLHDLDKRMRIATRQSISILSNTNFNKTYQCPYLMEISVFYPAKQLFYWGRKSWLCWLTHMYDWKELFLTLINGVWNLGIMVTRRMIWLVWPDQVHWCFCRLGNLLFSIPLDAVVFGCSVSGVCKRREGREGRRGRWEMKAFHVSPEGSLCCAHCLLHTLASRIQEEMAK